MTLTSGNFTKQALTYMNPFLLSIVRSEYDCFLEECDRSDRSCYQNGQCADKHVTYRAYKVNINPQFRNTNDGNYGSNDLAVITLDRVVRLTNTIIPICLPSPSQVQRLLSQKNMFVTGWGKLSSFTKGSDVLQQLQVRF